MNIFDFELTGEEMERIRAFLPIELNLLNVYSSPKLNDDYSE